MNITNLYHALLGLLIQLIVALIFGNWWLGAAVAIIFYALREWRQYKQRIEKNEAVHWTEDSTWDLVFPVVATLGAAWLVTSYFKGLPF